MTLLPPGLKVHLSIGYTDMRKGIGGLAMLVQAVLRHDPFCGHLFVFRGRNESKLRYCLLPRIKVARESPQNTFVTLSARSSRTGSPCERPLLKVLPKTAIISFTVYIQQRTLAEVYCLPEFDLEQPPVLLKEFDKAYRAVLGMASNAADRQNRVAKRRQLGLE